MAHSVSLFGREIDSETIGRNKFLFSFKTRQPLAVCFSVWAALDRKSLKHRNKGKKRVDSGNAMQKFGIYPYLCKKKN